MDDRSAIEPPPATHLAATGPPAGTPARGDAAGTSPSEASASARSVLGAVMNLLVETRHIDLCHGYTAFRHDLPPALRHSTVTQKPSEPGEVSLRRAGRAWRPAPGEGR
jgi:hypothetical protein